MYHVIARGNDRQRVFLDEADFASYLETLTACVDRFGWYCHAYCLMSNHYHLVLETPRPNLPLGMRQLNGLHAQRFNRRHDRCGHLFQSRYRSILVEKERHLLGVCRYVVVNPLRAGICEHADEYRWSSFRATAGISPPETLLTTDWILGQFGRSRRRAQASYADFVAAGLEEALRIRGERIGGKKFLRDRFGFEPPLAEIPRALIEPLRPVLAEIFDTSPQPIATAYREHDYTMREIGAFLGCHYSTVSRRLAEEELLVRQCKT